MNNLVKKTIAGFTVGVVTLYTLPVYAFASTESVYSKLRANGSVCKFEISFGSVSASYAMELSTSK